ncbi:MAG: Ig-like domain-containing protein [Candidatus Coatesbacteria bacterium]|nr:MAG: Ig-like domain-containing protein [Candidatus Coatesbacteria bacterium]
MARVFVDDAVTNGEPPYIDQQDPGDGDIGVSSDTDIVWHVNDDIGIPLGDWEDYVDFTVEIARTDVSGAITVSGTDPGYDLTFTFDPDDPLPYGATIEVTVDAEDTFGNTCQESWSFTVENDPETNVAPASIGVIKAGFVE